MDIATAIEALSALSQETRLRAFRLLVRQGAAGMPAGEIAEALGVPHNTMSSHLSILAHAGLVASRREGRSIIYRIDFQGIRALLAYLMEDCCRAAPEVCSPVLDEVLKNCCAPTAAPGENR